MTDWKQYRRKGFVEARPCKRNEEVSRVEISVSKEDVSMDFLEDPVICGLIYCRTDGGMIARNPDNPKDQWYINSEYWEKNYEEV